MMGTEIMSVPAYYTMYQYVNILTNGRKLLPFCLQNGMMKNNSRKSLFFCQDIGIYAKNQVVTGRYRVKYKEQK